MIPFAIFLILQTMGSPIQNRPLDESKGPLGLEGEQYWNQPLHQKPARIFGFELVKNDVDGIYLDGPSKIFFDRHSKVPLACLRSGSMKKLAKYNFSTTAWLAVSHLETGRIQLVLPSPEVPDPNAQPPSEGWTTVGAEIDLADIVDLGPKLGRYANVILCGPESSNQRILSLYPTEKAEGTPELEKKLRELREKGDSPFPLLIGKTLDHRNGGRPETEGPTGPKWMRTASVSTPISPSLSWPSTKTVAWCYIRMWDSPWRIPRSQKAGNRPFRESYHCP